MASKATKRANSVAAVPVAKKAKESAKEGGQASPKKAPSKKTVEASPKVESVFAGIVTALGNAHLPEHCREMLIAMVEPSLSTPKSERHATQILGVSMIEETLQDIKSRQMALVEEAQGEVSKIEESQLSRTTSVAEAQADLESKEAAEKSRQSARAEAENSVKEAETTLAAAKEAQEKGEEPLANLNAEKATLENISAEHVRVPMEAGEGPHFNVLEPHIQALGLDESLAIALPSSCAKTKDQRGGFDEVVLGELEKALAGKIASLTGSIAIEIPKVEERKVAVVSAEFALGDKTAAAKAAVAELEAAEAARVESAAILAKAKEALEALAPSIQEATIKLEELKALLSNFEVGPLATFQSYQNKAAPVEEAAPAGA